MGAMVIACALLVACGGGDDPGQSRMAGSDGSGSALAATTLAASLTALPLQAISAAESESLLFMREEEKLAHDVYLHIDGLWGDQARVFGNIAASEAVHSDAVGQLLARYALTDPGVNVAPGVFQNTLLQELYAQLVAASTPSLVDGLKVGAAIEEIDMLDINKAMSAIDNQDILMVYQNLLKGSRNHLRSFVATLTNQGVSYEPQYMVLADYLAIINAPMER